MRTSRAEAWFLVLSICAWLALAGALLAFLGCSETVDVGFEPPPEPVQVEQFGLDLYLIEEEDLPHDNLEPVIIIPRYDEIIMAWLRAAERDSSGSE